MSRTSTALKRLGVPALAAITVFAVVPAFTGTAQAAPTGITMTPDADSAAVGTCNPFTVQVSYDAAPATATVDVLISERVGSVSQTLTFCTTDATPSDATDNPKAPVGGGTGTAVGTAGTTVHGEFLTDASGKVTFGISATEPGTVDVRSFLESAGANNNNAYDEGEPTDTSVKTFTAGGNDNVRSLDAEPESQTKFPGETTTILATVRNAAGDTVPGVTPLARFNSGGKTGGGNPSCDPSDNDGVSRCTYVDSTVGTDSITVFVDQTQGTGITATAPNGGIDANEPQDTVTVTYVASPENLVITVTCDGPATDDTENTCVNPTSSGSETFTAVVTKADGTDSGTERDAAAGVVVRFTENGADATVAPVEATTDANGVATTTLTRTNRTAETITVTGTIRGQNATNDAPVTSTTGQRTSDTANKQFSDANVAADARNISLTPESATTGSGDARVFTATVTDRFGRPVQGVLVNFAETGPGRFVSGSSTASDTTDADGRATAEVVSFRDETGTQTITATIGGRNAGTADDECEQAAGRTADGSDAGTDPDVQEGASPAGNCSDSSTNTFAVGGASPSATPSATPTATTGPDCSVTPTISLEFGTINATGSSGITVTGPANAQIEVLAYSQPSTQYRVVRRFAIDNEGNPARDRITPPTNTRIYAQIVGCDTDETRFSKVLNVRTTLSLNVTRTGTRAYRFFGDSLPARPGGLIVSLYRVTNDGRQILTAQTRANAQNGDWVINRTFTGTGRFGFVVRTGQDLQNAPGTSNVRSLLIF